MPTLVFLFCTSVPVAIISIGLLVSKRSVL